MLDERTWDVGGVNWAMRESSNPNQFQDFYKAGCVDYVPLGFLMEKKHVLRIQLLI